MFHLSILVYVMILNKNYLWKIFTEDEFIKINYVGRHSAARLGRGFQTRPSVDPVGLEGVALLLLFFLCFSFLFSLFSFSGVVSVYFVCFFYLVAAVHRASLSPNSKISVDSDDSDQTSQRSGFMGFLSWLSWSTWISRSLFPRLSSIVLTINIRQHVLFFQNIFVF